MHIVRNGIEVPDELIRAHKEGRVVFFCGAGISYEAGLKDFQHLTEDVFQRVGERMNPAEEAAAKQCRWDAVLGSLENRIADRTQMRRKLMDALKPDVSIPNYSVETHKALLDLAFVNDEDPHLQLVTTNFDLLFEPLIKEQCDFVHRYAAPLLPTPRKGLWNGIVYLHGKLPEEYNRLELQNLVVASGDYGRAYLAEAWAARFVSELLRNYVVCFVGYSLGDQTVRYLMDAVDVYHRIGDKTEKVYIFTDSCEPDVLNQNRSLVSISYDSNACGGGHAVLHQTFQAWARRYKSGLDGKKALVRELAKINPAEIPDDGYIDQMMWALTDEKSQKQRTLETFSTLKSCPSFGWLEVFERNGFLDGSVFSYDNRDSKTGLLCHWILRMMGSREVVLWVVKNQKKICRNLFNLAESICNGEVESIDLDGFSKRLWRLIIAGKVDDTEDRDLYVRIGLESWIAVGAMDCVKRERIREVLKPVLVIQPSYGCMEKGKDGLTVGVLRNLLCLRIGFRGAGSQWMLGQIYEKLRSRLYEIVDVASEAFRQTLDEYCYLLGEECCEIDLAIDLPSIEEHWQNDSGYKAMPHLASIIREGWLQLANRDRSRARELALSWLNSKHLMLKRFALYAAKATDVLSAEDWLTSLLDWHGYLLWDSTVKREVMRLLVDKAGSLTSGQLEHLTDAVVRGYPACRRILFSGRVDYEDELVDHAKFVRLSKLQKVVGLLPDNGVTELNRIHQEHPQWVAVDDESDEFVMWGTWTGDPTEERKRKPIAVPCDAANLADWLESDAGRDGLARRYEQDDFEEVCKNHQEIVIGAFEILSNRAVWNVERIFAALRNWLTADTVPAAAKYLQRDFPRMSNEVFRYVANQAASWCEDAVRKNLIADDDLLSIGKILLDAEYEWDDHGFSFGKENDLVSVAINHPVGRIMTALIDKAFPVAVHKGEGIPPLYKELFEVVATSGKISARQGRLILASRGIALYYADEEWTRKYVLKNAVWDDLTEAQSFWQGFLWQRSMHVPLLVDIKGEFLETAKHYSLLCDSVHSYISLFISLALLHLSVFPDEEIESTIRGMSVPQLEDAAHVIESHMENVAKDGCDVDRAWRDDCWPILCGKWPQNEELLTDKIRDTLILALMHTKNVLAEGLGSMWFIGSQSVVNPSCVDERRDCYYLLNRCSESENMDYHPYECLEIIYRRVKGVRLWTSQALNACLSRLVKSDPTITGDNRYIELKRVADEAGV